MDELYLLSLHHMQSFIAIPSFLPYGSQIIYSNITEYWYKSPLRIAVENVIIEIIRLFSYLFFSTSFYVSLLSSRGFRRQALQSLGIKSYADHSNTIKTNSTNGQTKSANIIRKSECREM